MKCNKKLRETLGMGSKVATVSFDTHNESVSVFKSSNPEGTIVNYQYNIFDDISVKERQNMMANELKLFIDEAVLSKYERFSVNFAFNNNGSWINVNFDWNKSLNRFETLYKDKYNYFDPNTSEFIIFEKSEDNSTDNVCETACPCCDKSKGTSSEKIDSTKILNSLYDEFLNMIDEYINAYKTEDAGDGTVDEDIESSDDSTVDEDICDLCDEILEEADEHDDLSIIKPKEFTPAKETDESDDTQYDLSYTKFKSMSEYLNSKLNLEIKNKNLFNDSVYLNYIIMLIHMMFIDTDISNYNKFYNEKTGEIKYLEFIFDDLKKYTKESDNIIFNDNLTDEDMKLLAETLENRMGFKKVDVYNIYVSDITLTVNTVEPNYIRKVKVKCIINN